MTPAEIHMARELFRRGFDTAEIAKRLSNRVPALSESQVYNLLSRAREERRARK